MKRRDLLRSIAAALVVGPVAPTLEDVTLPGARSGQRALDLARWRAERRARAVERLIKGSTDAVDAIVRFGPVAGTILARVAVRLAQVDAGVILAEPPPEHLGGPSREGTIEVRLRVDNNNPRADSTRRTG